MNQQLPYELLKHLGVLVGLPLWAVIGGGASGSHILLCIGDKVPRDELVKNDKLRDVYRKFEPTYAILIYCNWILSNERNETIHHSGVESMDHENLFWPVVEAECKVSDIILYGKQIEFVFSNEWTLRLANDKQDDEIENFSFYDEVKNLVGSLNSKLEYTYEALQGVD